MQTETSALPMLRRASSLALRSIRHLDPISSLEIIALGAMVAALILVWLFPVNFYAPGLQSSEFAIQHYVVGFILALLTSAVLSRQRPTLGSLARMMRSVGALLLIIYLHFNYKLWAHLINPFLLDDYYERIDGHFTLIINVAELGSAIFQPITDWLPHAYHDLFVGMFLMTFLALAAGKNGTKNIDEVASAVALVLALGGLSYIVAPALGPFIYSPSGDLETHRIQQSMWKFQAHFTATGGAHLNSAQFIAALGAMPSLHAAHAWVLTHYALKHARWLGCAFVPALIFILCEAITLKWHYAIDLVVGVGLAYVCIHLTTRLMARSASALAPARA